MIWLECNVKTSSKYVEGRLSTWREIFRWYNLNRFGSPLHAQFEIICASFLCKLSFLASMHWTSVINVRLWHKILFLPFFGLWFWWNPFISIHARRKSTKDLILLRRKMWHNDFWTILMNLNVRSWKNTVAGRL